MKDYIYFTDYTIVDICKSYEPGYIHYRVMDNKTKERFKIMAKEDFVLNNDNIREIIAEVNANEQATSPR